MTIYNHFVPTGIKSLDAEIGGLKRPLSQM